jgi:hypothetical protein
MSRFYHPDLADNIDSPFVHDGNNKLIRRSYWLDMDDRTLVMLMTKGIGASLTNETRTLGRHKTRTSHRAGLPPGNTSS